MTDPALQTAFSRVKGSVPVHLSADVSSLSPYQQKAAASLRQGPVLWSIVHGSAMGPRFQAGFYDAVQTYVRSRDAKVFSKTLSDAVAAQPPLR